MEFRQTSNSLNDAYRKADAQVLLRAAVEWHREHEGEVLPAPLLAILVAARRVC